MSRTHDTIAEIAQVRERRRFGSAIAELPHRLFVLESAFKSHDKGNEELTRYFPVALVACMEGYFRLAIKELVDAGEPYLSNAERPASALKLDFTLLRAVHGKTVTIGDLVGHGVPLSRLEHIDSTMSSLLGRPFIAGLRTVHDRWSVEVRGESPTPMLVKPDNVFSQVARTFELRHIICHELASAHEVGYEEVADCFEGSVAFLKAADELVSETLHPNAPLTQTDMNIAAGQSLNQARAALNEAFNNLKIRLDEKEIVAIGAAQDRWEEYCNAWAEFDAMQVEGGTMWPLVRAGAEEAMVRKRTEELLSYRRMEDSAQ